MSKRPIRVTLSMTSEEYDRLCWLAFYWKENPSTCANSLLQEEIERKISANQQLQKQYALYRKSQLQQVPGSGTRKREANGQSSNPLPAHDGG